MKLELSEYRFCTLCGAPVELQQEEGRKRPVCTSCGHIVYINPTPAVALVINNAGKVLLTLRNAEPHPGEWCLPGGFIEWGESSEEASRRELFEETGITAEKISLIGVFNSISEPGRHVLLIAYRILSWTGKPIAGDDAQEVAWFEINTVPPLAFTVHEKVLSDSLK